MKTIKQMYEELNAEVIRKIKAGDFTVTKIEKHVVTIEVEGLTLSFWIARGSKFNVQRAEKANRREHAKYEQFMQWRERALKAIERKIRDENV